MPFGENNPRVNRHMHWESCQWFYGPKQKRQSPITHTIETTGHLSACLVLDTDTCPCTSPGNLEGDKETSEQMSTVSTFVAEVGWGWQVPLPKTRHGADVLSVFSCRGQESDHAFFSLGGGVGRGWWGRKGGCSGDKMT